MTKRFDPMFYDVEIRNADGQENKSQVGAWWSGDASANGLRQMCDCQLAGYFHAKPSGQPNKLTGRPTWNQAFTRAQHNYLQASPCSHDKPSKKFEAVRAHLPGGEVVEIAA